MAANVERRDSDYVLEEATYGKQKGILFPPFGGAWSHLDGLAAIVLKQVLRFVLTWNEATASGDSRRPPRVGTVIRPYRHAGDSCLLLQSPQGPAISRRSQPAAFQPSEDRLGSRFRAANRSIESKVSDSRQASGSAPAYLRRSSLAPNSRLTRGASRRPFRPKNGRTWRAKYRTSTFSNRGRPCCSASRIAFA